MVNLIFSHIIVFILGMVVMAQMFALNQQPRPPRSPLEVPSDEEHVLRKALFHIMEANRWLSCAPQRGRIYHLPTFMDSIETMLRRRIASIDASQRHDTTTNTTTSTEPHAHD